MNSSASGPERVVITGLGAVSGYGIGVGALDQGLKKGETAIRFQAELPEVLPCRIAASVPDLPSFPLPVRTKAALMGLMAAREAWQQAGLDLKKHAGSFRIHAAMGWGPYDFEELRQLHLGEAVSPHFDERTQCGHGPEVLEFFFQPGLGVSSYLSACAASTQAIGRAYYDLKSGRARVSLAGGSDTRMHAAGILGYAKLGALATGFEKKPSRACRPFDAERSGFVIGEGAGFVVMETLSHARERGATVLAEVLATATNTDAFRLTDPQPDGGMAALCMQECLKRAGKTPSKVDYVQAHGTGTFANDAAEAASLKRVFSKESPRVPVSSLKPYFGHLSMAAGALETVSCVLMLRGSFLPPCLNLENPDKDFDLNFVRESRPPREIKTILKNSFGFGGQNACLLLGRAE